MEQLPPSPAPHQPALASAESAAAVDRSADPGANCCGAAQNSNSVPRKLDLTGMAAPGDLSAARLEEFTIDGICGVY